MAKKSKQTQILPARLSRLSRAQLSVVAAFVLTFVGFGSLYVVRSQASGGCVYYQYSVGSSGQCVKDLQQMIHNIYHYGTLGHWSGFSDGALGYSFGSAWYPDGQFGSGTKYQVQLFQKRIGLSQDGIVGHYTWGTLCGQDFAAGRMWVYNDAGCYHL